MSAIKWETTFILTWQLRLIPRFHYDKSTWPRCWQFHWLCFYAHSVGTPA